MPPVWIDRPPLSVVSEALQTPGAGGGAEFDTTGASIISSTERWNTLEGASPLQRSPSMEHSTLSVFLHCAGLHHTHDLFRNPMRKSITHLFHHPHREAFLRYRFAILHDLLLNLLRGALLDALLRQQKLNPNNLLHDSRHGRIVQMLPCALGNALLPNVRDTITGLLRDLHGHIDDLLLRALRNALQGKVLELLKDHFQDLSFKTVD